MYRHVAFTIVVLLFVTVLYVLSFAPVCRCRSDDWSWTLVTIDGRQYSSSPGRQTPGYQPVVWMIDRTVLREPILRWGDVWGVRGQMLANPLPSLLCPSHPSPPNTSGTANLNGNG